MDLNIVSLAAWMVLNIVAIPVSMAALIKTKSLGISLIVFSIIAVFGIHFFMPKGGALEDFIYISVSVVCVSFLARTIIKRFGYRV